LSIPARYARSRTSGRSLASFGKTVMSALGVDSTVIESAVISGKVIAGAIAK
jgi:hypothetical protein